MASTRLRYGSTLALFVVALIVGVLFASSAALFRDDDGARPSDLVGLIREQNRRVADLEEDVADLNLQREELLSTLHGEVPGPDTKLLTAGAATELRGGGVRVQMWDASAVLPADPRFDVNDLVVHQQDLEGVINALWAGGAEGITVQGHRLHITSAVRCVGNVLLIHGRQYSPPYVIEAIGDPERLREAVYSSPAVQVYLQYVDAVGLGWQFQQVPLLRLPAAAPVRAFSFATTVE